MNLINTEIDRLRELIKESDIKLRIVSGSEKVKELYRNAHLHHELKKMEKLKRT